MPSKLVEIVPPSHRQGHCILFAVIRWPDFGRPRRGRMSASGYKQTCGEVPQGVRLYEASYVKAAWVYGSSRVSFLFGLCPLSGSRESLAKPPSLAAANLRAKVPWANVFVLPAKRHPPCDSVDPEISGSKRGCFRELGPARPSQRHSLQQRRVPVERRELRPISLCGGTPFAPGPAAHIRIHPRNVGARDGGADSEYHLVTVPRRNEKRTHGNALSLSREARIHA